MRPSLDDAPNQPSRFARFASAFFVASPVLYSLLYSNHYSLVFLFFRHHEHLYRYRLSLPLSCVICHRPYHHSPLHPSRTPSIIITDARHTLPLPLTHRFFVIEFQPLNLRLRRSQRGSSAHSRQVCRRRCRSLFRHKLTFSLSPSVVRSQA